MASIYSAIACPNCGRCATEDDYYNIDEKMIWCFRCGYYYEKVTKYNVETDEFSLEENEYKGYGKCFVLTKEGEVRENALFNHELSKAEIDTYFEIMEGSDIDKEKSYFVLFIDGEFQLMAGTEDEEFYLPFNEYKAIKEEKGESIELIVPM